MVHEILKLGQPYVPAILVDPSDYEEHCRLAQYLPSEITRDLGFERIVAGDDTSSGLAMYIPSKEATWDYIHQSLPEDLMEKHAWQALVRLTDLLQLPGSQLYQAWHGLWLEFDTVRNDFLIPDIFLSFNAHKFFLSDMPDMLLTCMKIIQGAPVDPAIEAKLREIVSLAPEGTTIQQMGAMLSRGLKGVRIVMQIPKIDETMEFLEKIGWQGDIEQVREQVTWMVEKGKKVVLNLDIGAQLHPRISIEANFRNYLFGVLNPLWDELLDKLVERDMCDPAVRDALLNFTQQFSINEGKNYIRCELSHMKMVFQPNTPPHAKVYFGFRQRDKVKVV